MQIKEIKLLKEIVKDPRPLIRFGVLISIVKNIQLKVREKDEIK